MGRIGPFELLIILVIVLLVFGAGKLPEIGGAIGKSIREFKRAQKEDNEPAKAAAKPAEVKTETPVKTETKS